MNEDEGDDGGDQQAEAEGLDKIFTEAGAEWLHAPFDDFTVDRDPVSRHESRWQRDGGHARDCAGSRRPARSRARDADHPLRRGADLGRLVVRVADGECFDEGPGAVEEAVVVVAVE